MGIVYYNKGLEKPMGRIPPNGANGLEVWAMILGYLAGLCATVAIIVAIQHHMRYQPYEKIDGHVVVRNAAQLNAYKREHYMTQDKSHPAAYPAIVNEYIDSGEDPYLAYTTVADCEGMIEALTKRPQVEKEEAKP